MQKYIARFDCSGASVEFTFFVGGLKAAMKKVAEFEEASIKPVTFLGLMEAATLTK